ncbi:MAG TPA: hypothetical protein IAA80_08715 [Candidatus Gallacutalibacter pullistercoris]|nr:hypothetical protein [Candidatus Gallacutalibacter pullistercoris]
MSSIKDALKALCQIMTGQESTGQTIAEVISDITANYPPLAEPSSLSDVGEDETGAPQ